MDNEEDCEEDESDELCNCELCIQREFYSSILVRLACMVPNPHTIPIDILMFVNSELEGLSEQDILDLTAVSVNELKKHFNLPTIH